MSSYTALTNFSYPSDIEVRENIRRFHRVSNGKEKNQGVRYPGDRGPIAEVVVGQVLVDPPADLLEHWLQNGYVKEVE